MEFSRPEYWSSLSLLQGIFPTQGTRRKSEVKKSEESLCELCDNLKQMKINIIEFQKEKRARKGQKVNSKSNGWKLPKFWERSRPGTWYLELERSRPGTWSLKDQKQDQLKDYPETHYNEVKIQRQENSESSMRKPTPYILGNHHNDISRCLHRNLADQKGEGWYIQSTERKKEKTTNTILSKTVLQKTYRWTVDTWKKMFNIAHY